MKRIFTFLAVCFCLALVSCEKGPGQESLGLARHDIDVSRNGGLILISSENDFDFGELSILKDGNWVFAENEGIFYDRDGLKGLKCDWVKVTELVDDAATHFIQIEVKPNRTNASRSCSIGVHSEVHGEVVTVRQK